MFNMNPLVEALAQRVRQLREAHGLSLSQLSERSGIAKATLFKIERGRTNPTLETLQSIAETFDVTVQHLLDVASSSEVEVVPAGEGLDITDDASIGRVIRKQVIGAGSLEIHHQTFLVGKRVTSPPHGAGSREHVYVLDGTIIVGPVGHERQIEKGDYAAYPCHLPHHWEAVDGEATVLIVHTFPSSNPYPDL